MGREATHSDGAPKAVGPYSQAVRAGPFLFTSGQVGMSPATGELVGDDVAAQTRQVFANLRAVLASAGCSLEDVVKCNVFLTDMGDFSAMNAVYGEHFAEPPPARSTVAVAALPRAALVEIECVALLPEG